MTKFHLSFSYFVIAITVIAVSIHSCSTFDNKIDYSTQVKPILNKHCLACHGGVKKQGDFSLLFREEALARTKSGKYAIIPGNAANSEMIKRINHDDPEERMPYQKDPLTNEEIKILTKWIDQGAEWGEHWAYQSVSKPEVPKISDDWVNNDIDKFILKSIKEQGIKNSPKASNEILLRRLALDITGLPPSEDEIMKLSNSSKFDTDNVITQFLASLKYGEKWASMWLDLARYADTKGYERDDNRNIWRYRDWLIKAFNEDQPYDKFITDQLAGDLYPSPQDDQYIATAFHRNTMTNDEGGTDNEEFRTAAVIDRVNTTWETLMGTTFACVQCHSHPYDPFKHEEYYQFMSFFNNTRDEDTYHDYPVLRHFDPFQKNQLITLEKNLSAKVDENYKKELSLFLKTLQPSINSIACKEFINSELSDTKFLAMRTKSSCVLPNVNLSDKTHLILQAKFRKSGGSFTMKNKKSGEVVVNWKPNTNELHQWINFEIPIKSMSGVHDLILEYNNPSLTNPNEYGINFNWFYFNKGLPEGDAESDSIRKSFYTLLNANVASTPIMVENPNDMKRENHLFERGSWLSKGNLVNPGTPSILNKFEKGMPVSRLGLAQWMTDKRNPLLARTIVNRVWEQLFGTGLVETVENMGTQGASPSHPELLDYLSWQLMNDYKWSIKTLIKEIVSSSTYQQSSFVPEEHLKLDPYNKYLARGPRVRLSAEQVRDQALLIAGVLNDTMYGPPVMPFQPEGIWSSPYDGNKWVMSSNKQKYRRAIYTFWKRTSPYPSMVTFDGVNREVCVSRRIRTNTPLQALVTLNDSVYVDLSRSFAKRILSNKNFSLEKKIEKAYELATCKKINKTKLSALTELYNKAFTQYKDNEDLNCLVGEGMNINDADFSAMAMVCNAILNLDEVLTKS